MNTKLQYESIEPGYYHKAFISGNPIQRYWHFWRFMKIIENIESEGKKILDLGCGPGTLLSLIPENYETALGIDFDEKQIHFAKTQFCKKKKIIWLAGDIRNIDINDRFDYIICSEVLEHLTKQEANILLQRIKQLMKKDGKLIVTTPNYKSFWPIVEKFVNLLGKVNYVEQHINKLNIQKLKNTLEHNELKIAKIESFYIIAPFLVPLSTKLARFIQKIENKLLPGFGYEIIAVATQKNIN